VSPQAQRSRPLHQQIFDHYERLIVDGNLQPGDRLPPVRATAEEWGVGQQAAQRAYELLRASKLVRTSPQGTVVTEPRNTYGPQQRARALRYSPGITADVRDAGRVLVTPAWSYVIPILGLRPDPEGDYEVLRREELISDEAGPVMLLVTWTAPVWAERVPELLVADMLPDPRDAAHLIADRWKLAVEWGEYADETRPPMQDGREIPLLGLQPGEYVGGKTWTWGRSAGEDEIVLVYEEAAVRPGRVIRLDMEP
jgi:DNA-binding transcriptional regulator YhcF (GntR family)